MAHRDGESLTVGIHAGISLYDRGSMIPQRLSLALLAAAGLVTSSCTLAKPPGPVREIRVEAMDTTATLPSATKVVVSVLSQDKQRFVATGEAAAGATIRTLVRSLQASLRAHGIESVYRDANPKAEPLTRSMDQILEGWHVQRTGVRVPKGKPRDTVAVTMRPR